MPIKIPNSLPARETLESENIFVMTEYRAMHQDMRPLNLVNTVEFFFKMIQFMVNLIGQGE